MEVRFVKKKEDLIIPLLFRFSQSYQVVLSDPKGVGHKNIAQISGGKRSIWIPLEPVSL